MFSIVFVSLTFAASYKLCGHPKLRVLRALIKRSIVYQRDFVSLKRSARTCVAL